MKDKINKGIYLKEEIDFVPNLKKNNKNNSKSKGDNDGKKKKKGNGKNISQ